MKTVNYFCQLLLAHRKCHLLAFLMTLGLLSASCAHHTWNTQSWSNRTHVGPFGGKADGWGMLS
jgi:hypothetical protein